MDTRELIGKYAGKVIESALSETQKGDPQVALYCELGGEGPEKGIKLTYYGYFTEKTEEHTLNALRAAGWTGNDMTELADWKKAVPQPLDVELVIEQEDVVDEQNQATGTRPRIRWINPQGKIGVRTRMAPDKAAAFAQRMKGRLAKFDHDNGAPKNNGAASQRPSPPRPASTGTDDIPF